MKGQESIPGTESVGQGGEVGEGPALFDRKPWDELSRSTQREYERRGHTREAHDRGEPIPPPTDKSPKRSKGKRRPAPQAPAAPKWKPDELRADLTRTIARMGTVVYLAEPFDGTVILTNAEPLADALVGLAERNERIRRALESMGQVGDAAQLVGTVVMMGAAIALHHGLLPVGQLSPAVIQAIVPPEALEQDPNLAAHARGERVVREFRPRDVPTTEATEAPEDVGNSGAPVT